MSDDEETPFIQEGALPPNAVPVHSFRVGYGEVAAADEEGVTALPMVTVMTNDGDGPMLLFSLEGGVRLIGELSTAVPKSVARFDPKFAETVQDADAVIARTTHAQQRTERGLLLGYLAVLGLVCLLGAVGVGVSGKAGLAPTGNLLTYVFGLLGVTYLLKMLAVELAEWQNNRDRKKRHGG